MASLLAVFPLAFPGVGSSSSASNITQLRGNLHPLLPSLPPTPLFSVPFPLQLSHAGRSLHPRQPRALIIAFLSGPVALKSTPPPSPSLAPTPLVAHLHLHLLPAPTALPLRKSSMKKTSPLPRMFCIQALSQKRLCIRQTYGCVFKILSLFKQSHQSSANFLSLCGWSGRRLAGGQMFEGKFLVVLFSLNMKVIKIFH